VKLVTLEQAKRLFTAPVVSQWAPAASGNCSSDTGQSQKERKMVLFNKTENGGHLTPAAPDELDGALYG